MSTTAYGQLEEALRRYSDFVIAAVGRETSVTDPVEAAIAFQLGFMSGVRFSTLFPRCGRLATCLMLGDGGVGAGMDERVAEARNFVQLVKRGRLAVGMYQWPCDRE